MNDIKETITIDAQEIRNKENEVIDSLRSQFATLNETENKRGAHRKYLPYAFTEQRKVKMVKSQNVTSPFLIHQKITW